ncbi:MAG: nitrilase, partial [Aquificota bacterium]
RTSLLLLPEMFSSGFDNENLETHAKETAKIYKNLKKISLDKNLVISGTLPEKSKNGIYNKAFVIDNGEVIFKRAKVKLFTPTGEDKYFKAGKNNFDIVESSVGNLGIMICFELRFPNISYTLRKKGVEILLIPAQWGSSRKEHLEVLSRARAIETQSFCIISDTVGKIGRVSYAGSSAIYDPWGEKLAFIDDKEGIIEADINLNEVYRVRKKIKMNI